MEVDLSTEVVTFRIVYAGSQGASTLRNLRGLHISARVDERDDLTVLWTAEDRFVSFLYSPRAEPQLGGMRVAFQAVAAPGRVHARAAQQLLLLSADALVFLPDRLDPSGPETRDAFRELVEDLEAAGRRPGTLPIVIQDYCDADPRLDLGTLSGGGDGGIRMVAVQGDTVEGVIEVFDAARSAAREQFQHLDRGPPWVPRCLQGLRQWRRVTRAAADGGPNGGSSREQLLVRTLLAVVFVLALLCCVLALRTG